MADGSQAFTTPQAVVGRFHASLGNLEPNLRMWIGDALRAPNITTGLSRLCLKLELGIARNLISLPDRLRAVQLDRYARRLVYDDPATGVSVLAMVWAPGHSTPLHDHSGLWGVEAVLEGEIETVPFELAGQQNGKYFFDAQPAERLRAGSTSYLMPPFEDHVTRNVSRQVAITLNIYGGAMPACNVFMPTGDGSYVRQRRVLSYSE
jgi:predicted metal-dependent enzyme (double-stranded beta helix superfamily)